MYHAGCKKGETVLLSTLSKNSLFFCYLRGYLDYLKKKVNDDCLLEISGVEMRSMMYL